MIALLVKFLNTYNVDHQVHIKQKIMEELKRLILEEKMKDNPNQEYIRSLQQVLDLLIKKQERK